MATSARIEAIERLHRVEKDHAYTALLEGSRQLSPQDERLVTEMVAGITRWRRWLDFIVEEFYHGSSAELDPEVRQVLRLGIYELLFLRTPSYAAINEAVEVAKRVSHRGVVGLVNGVLRSVERAREQLPEPDTGDLAGDLAVRYSHPTWLTRRWLKRYGIDGTRRLLAWNNERPKFSVRVNSLKIDREAFLNRLESHDIEAHQSSLFEDFVVVNQLQEIFEHDLVDGGLCSVQGQGAGSVVRLLDPKPGELVLDLCSAPGGKTMYAAERMENRGRIVAIDRHSKRLELVTQNARRLGVTIVDGRSIDAREVPDRTDLRGDRVLLDVPCTGTGVLNTRADLRWQLQQEDLAELQQLQDQLFDAAARSTRSGGVLVYSTCSLEPEENEQRVDAFLERHPEFVREEGDGRVSEALLDEKGQLRTLPHVQKVDGAFGARLRRTD